MHYKLFHLLLEIELLISTHDIPTASLIDAITLEHVPSRPTRIVYSSVNKSWEELTFPNRLEVVKDDRLR